MFVSSARAREVIDVRGLAERVAATFPALTERGRRVALEVYRTLALGRPVPDYAVAAVTRLQIREVRDELDAWPGVCRGETGRIVGFWGLTLDETPHSFEVDGRVLYTWCAWDALFLPELLGRPALIRSTCARTDQEIVIRVANDELSVEPGAAVVSLVDPQDGDVDGDAIISTFCRHVFFFASRDEGESWVRERVSRALILSIEDAFAVGRAFNQLRFCDALKVRP